MPAWLIIRARVHDREAFVAGYAPATAALVTKFGGVYLVRSPRPEVLEGTDHGGSLVVSQWPDRAAALAFWNSAEYAEVKRLRDGLADVEVLLVEEPPAA